MGLLGGGTNKRELNTFKAFGKDQFAYGRDLTNAGLSGLDDLDSRFNAELDAGGLPKYMEDAFGRAGGRLTDDAARSKSAFAADLMQIAKRSGGRLDPNASLDYQVENDAAINDSLFNARNDLAGTEAEVRMENTNRLLDRIFAIRDRKLGTGQAEEQAGVNAWESALQLKQRRSLARAQMASNIATTAMSRGGR